MKRHLAIRLLLCLFVAATAPSAQAFVVNIGFAVFPSIYLRIGDGAYIGTYQSAGIPGSNATVNLVSVSVPAASIGNGTSLAMASNATQTNSNYDGAVRCNLPAQVYVGGYNRGGLFSANSGILTVTSPASLTTAAGDSIPFSQISWTSSGAGDTGAQPFPAGTFTGGTQTLAAFPVNTWRESCHAFSYRNNTVVAAGTYTGRVTYTLSVP